VSADVFIFYFFLAVVFSSVTVPRGSTADELFFFLAPFWGNAELRSYTLEIAAGEDGEVSLVEEKESLERRGLPN